MLGEILLSCFNKNGFINRRKVENEFALNNYSIQFRKSYNIDRITNCKQTRKFEEDDRNDVISMLPDLKNKKILDIGFNVGRFTVELARRGKYINVTDFKLSSYDKLKILKKLANKSNKLISVRISDLTSINYKSQKFHLIFTNWLFMYLNDEECYRFLNKSLKWLEKGGYLKFRESCGESVTKLYDYTFDSSVDSLDKQNIPIYRYISVYLKLIEEIRIKDKNGLKWKYEITICCVIPTCIEKAYKWNEIQLMAKKVNALDGDMIPDKQELLNNIADNWIISQEATDIYVDTIERFFADKIFLSEIKKCPMGCVDDPSIMTATIIYQSSVNPYYMRICPFNMPTSDKSFIWTNDEDRSFFKSSLSIAEKKKNSSMFFSYSKKKIHSIFEYATKLNIRLNGFLAVNFLSDNNLDFIDEFIKNANEGAKIIFLESYINNFDKKIKLQKIKCPFVAVCRTRKIHKIVVKDKYPEGVMKYVTSRKWMLIRISINEIKNKYI
ncbi:Protein of unknown function DUF858, methyltransferase-like family-containing protein [Strongyloides ratti]|uniref:phosphoethanolamine N-methyltransferase n=1 Tax=Strongyloides ratti TaxID=34506 RepID=A0A090LTD5_STRRB|nr:Protein of unknown function DUF858, methyltransferase-like family-containing protein [Strongyloides ratti]CEF71482.1 Protein of unknown function DUF858, methyltransferase-like family-containing protein [Strongyloides ratti]